LFFPCPLIWFARAFAAPSVCLRFIPAIYTWAMAKQHEREFRVIFSQYNKCLFKYMQYLNNHIFPQHKPSTICMALKLHKTLHVPRGTLREISVVTSNSRYFVVFDVRSLLYKRNTTVALFQPEKPQEPITFGSF
jgi:hypothetical protein